MLGLEIRPYHEGDKERCLAICRQAIPAMLGANEFELFAEFLRALPPLYYVGEFEGEVIACGGLTVIPEDNSARISWLLVCSALHRRGVGSRFLDFLRGVLSADCPSVRLLRLTCNETSFKFYSSHGFELVEVAAQEYAPGLHDYHMQRCIGANG